MTMIGYEIPVRAEALSRMAQKRANRPARSPASTECLDILCPPPGASEVISHLERLSSNEMKMALICVWIAAGSAWASSDIGRLQNEWILQPQSATRPAAIHPPWNLRCADKKQT